MKCNKKTWMTVLIALALSQGVALATQRLFTYTYEPEVLPKGALEFEQWVTWRGGRSADTGQQDYSRWQFREEFEYGVTDNYTASFYLNTRHQSFTDPAAGTSTSEFKFDGISLENRYMVLNPAEHPIGLTLYLEPTYSGEEFELEQKIIIGQRHGKWKWALNLSHATEWDLRKYEKEGEFEVAFGITRKLGKHWHLGVELRNHNELPEYKKWENTAFYLGPVVSYERGDWWATMSVMPQVWGKNTAGGPDPDGYRGLELEGHERINVRLIVGFGF